MSYLGGIDVAGAARRPPNNLLNTGVSKSAAMFHDSGVCQYEHVGFMGRMEHKVLIGEHVSRHG